MIFLFNVFYYTPYIDRSDLSDSPRLGEITAPRLGHVWGFIDSVFGVCRFVLIGDFLCPLFIARCRRAAVSGRALMTGDRCIRKGFLSALTRV